MAFIVQDDVGIVDANSYTTVQAFKDYHDERGNVYVVLLPTDPDIQKVLIKATDYLDQRFSFVGQKVQPKQRTQWPRIGAEDADGFVRSGVPHDVKEACIDYALIAASAALNPTPTRDATGGVVVEKSESVGPISEGVRFSEGSPYELPRYPLADEKLKRTGLLETGSTRIRRA